MEQCWYDADGASSEKVSSTTTTYTLFDHYEEEVMCDVVTAISYDSFAGLRIAVPYHARISLAKTLAIPILADARREG